MEKYIVFTNQSILDLHNWRSRGETAGINTGDNTQGVFVIYLFQDAIRQFQAVHFPERMPFALVIEIFIAGFQYPEIYRVLGWIPGIFSK